MEGSGTHDLSSPTADSPGVGPRPAPRGFAGWTRSGWTYAGLLGVTSTYCVPYLAAFPITTQWRFSWSEAWAHAAFVGVLLILFVGIVAVANLAACALIHGVMRLVVRGFRPRYSLLLPVLIAWAGFGPALFFMRISCGADDYRFDGHFRAALFAVLGLCVAFSFVPACRDSLRHLPGRGLLATSLLSLGISSLPACFGFEERPPWLWREHQATISDAARVELIEGTVRIVPGDHLVHINARVFDWAPGPACTTSFVELHIEDAAQRLSLTTQHGSHRTIRFGEDTFTLGATEELLIELESGSARVVPESSTPLRPIWVLPI